MNESDDIVKEFLVESYENLDRLDRDLITLEKHPKDREILGSVFRTIHTIKGTSGFLDFDKLGAVAHVGESLLGRLRDGQLELDREITSGLLAMVDAVRQMLGSIEATGVEGERDDTRLIARLTGLQQPSEAPPKGHAAPVPERTGDGVPNIGSVLTQRAGVTAAQIKSAAEEQTAGDPRHIGEILVEQGAAQPSDAVAALRVQRAAGGPSASGSTIRLDVGLLDHLMNLVGELVLARNQILQFANRTEESTLVAASQQLNLITTELQGGVMKTRMQPIGNIWSKFPRTVRDLALECGKQVRVEMEGQETELDKTLIEAIKDPLTHLVRNSVDHGIETPEVRQAAGKSPEGRLGLRAFHEGGQVNIEISDDGAGLDQERIRNKAVQKGLISADQASRLSDRETVNLVFLPGFSTAEKITNVSGRGVGMDVVKTHIEKIGGTVDLQSKRGEGVLVRMKIPLTLAIIPALIVTSESERYAIPQVSLLELVRLEQRGGHQGIEMIHGSPVYRLRGRLLPLIYLSRELAGGAKAAESSTAPRCVSRKNDAPPDAASEGSQAVNIVVLEAEGRQFGLVVDEINDTEEIVVKPLSKHLKSISVYAGATIMGDGRVALILDVLGLAQCSSILAEGREHLPTEAAEAASGGRAKQKLVLFTGRAGSRMAVPLEMLARLENIPGPEVERSGNQWVTQYRGQILPLIRVTHALEERRQLPRGEGLMTLPTTETLQVLVLENEQQSFGLVVNQILDIVESTLEPQSPSTRAGVLHCSVISKKVTELLDVAALLRTGEAYEPTGSIQ
ncbi:MAG TPA: chemotaxis protein CheA [Terriglobales bacterium]|jgi:two-component system chemotaxis sensor kinase CheA|nr:chemotaxis protein CheA [Terriglobales bacterium]